MLPDELVYIPLAQLVQSLLDQDPETVNIFPLSHFLQDEDSKVLEFWQI